MRTRGERLALPLEKRLKFFVYIIESPAAVDLYHGRSEGTFIQRALELGTLPCVTRTAISRTAFIAAIRIGLTEEMKQFNGLVPVVHISAHGNTQGIQLSDGDIIDWDTLREMLVPVNQALGGSLLLSVSACEGFAACTMAMDEGDHPFFAVVGHTGKPTWSDTALAYAVFYNLVRKGEFIVDAVKGMNAAIADDNFAIITAADAQKRFLDRINNVDAAEAQQELEQQAASDPPSPDAKKLEASSVAV